MDKTFKASSRARVPRSQHDLEEFGKGKKGLMVCSNCNIFYYKKSWHHSADSFVAKRESSKSGKDLAVNFKLCPACEMIKNKQYEGRVVIRKAPSEVKEELVNLIKHFGQKAYSIDPLDRVIDIKDQKGEIIVTTTENEMANKMARRIKSVFHKVKTTTSFAKAPSDVALVVVEFL